MKTKIMTLNSFVLTRLWLILLISLPLKAEQTDQAFISGVDYELIVKSGPQNKVQLAELESISNIEIFYWYGCESCYQVEAAIAEYLQQNPALMRRTPLVMRTAWRQQAYIQPLMAQLTELQNLPTVVQIYQQCLIDCNRLKDFDAILDWFSENLPEQRLPLIDKEVIWQTEKNYQKRADLFSISQVPTIIINETYKIDANRAQTARRLVEIIDFLIARERN